MGDMKSGFKMTLGGKKKPDLEPHLGSRFLMLIEKMIIILDFKPLKKQHVIAALQALAFASFQEQHRVSCTKLETLRDPKRRLSVWDDRCRLQEKSTFCWQ